MTAALLLASVLGLTGQGSSILDDAERAYRAGRFVEASALYQAALSEPGGPEGVVLYNLGNCAYRLRRYAEAVLCYRRALLRRPRDPQVTFNLRRAEAELGAAVGDGGSFGAAVVELIDWFTPRELLALVGVMQAAGVVGIVVLRRRRAARLAMAGLVLLTLAGAARLVHGQWFARPAGVVLVNELVLRTDPHRGLPAILKLQAGETVKVEELSDRWVRVVHPRGGGWTERGGIGVVD